LVTALNFVNPEGIQSSSPGLAFSSQPWEPQNQEIQPQRGCVSDRWFKQNPKPPQPCSGLRIDFFISQGWLTPTLGWRAKSLRDLLLD
jgi:hypothetical protein